jgi:hypothetical protein
MTEIRNEFSWSKSRDEIFQTCPRQYYFNYYGTGADGKKTLKKESSGSISSRASSFVMQSSVALQ